MSTISLRLTVNKSGLHLKGFEARPSGRISPPSKHMGGRDVVSHPVYPSPQATKSVVKSETPPDCYVDLLKEIFS